MKILNRKSKMCNLNQHQNPLKPNINKFPVIQIFILNVISVASTFCCFEETVHKSYVIYPVMSLSEQLGSKVRQYHSLVYRILGKE